jgi:hypothetical protein
MTRGADDDSCAQVLAQLAIRQRIGGPSLERQERVDHDWSVLKLGGDCLGQHIECGTGKAIQNEAATTSSR